MRTPLNTPVSAIRWGSRTTTALGVSGRPIRDGDYDTQDEANETRFGTIMNPYIPSSAPSGTVRQLFVSEPFYDTIAVVNLTVSGTAPYQVFGLGSVTRIRSQALKFPVD